MSGEILPKGVMSDEEIRKIAENSATEATIGRVKVYIENGAGGVASQRIAGSEDMVVIEFWNGKMGEPKIVSPEE